MSFSSLDGQEIAPEAPKLLPYQQNFTNLPKEKRIKFLELLSQAQILLTNSKYLESLNTTDQAEQIFPDTPEASKIRGDSLMQLRIFDQAMNAYEKSLTISPNDYSLMFNIAEIHFVTKKWQQSYDLFQKVIPKLSKEQKEILRITEFKILLNLLKLGRESEAITLSKKYDYMDDSPFHYYAESALAFHKHSETEAYEWIAKAKRVFRNPQILQAWQDSMVEIGFIKAYYGGDESQ